MWDLLFLGFFNALSLLVLWFESPLKITLGKLLFKQYYTKPEEFDDKLFTVNYFLGTISGCFICLSFWISLIVGICYTLILQLPMYFPIITFLTYPGVCYLALKTIKR